MGAVLIDLSISSEELSEELHGDGASLTRVAAKLMGYEVVTEVLKGTRRKDGTMAPDRYESLLQSEAGELAVSKGVDGVERVVARDGNGVNVNVIDFVMQHRNVLKTPEMADVYIRQELGLDRRNNVKDELRRQNDGALHMAHAFSAVLAKRGAPLSVVASLFGYVSTVDTASDERYLLDRKNNVSAVVTSTGEGGTDVAHFVGDHKAYNTLAFARRHDPSLPSKPMLMADALVERLKSQGVALRF